MVLSRNSGDRFLFEIPTVGAAVRIQFYPAVGLKSVSLLTASLELFSVSRNKSTAQFVAPSSFKSPQNPSYASDLSDISFGFTSALFASFLFSVLGW